ncbi:hypothetical protein EC957_000271 [Mortierella hygrophila]|uniref:DUF300-domain-containing protein n=1 Tax=Mortierella hygrophila TaxID=979708 RepID=A0A9P6F7Y1_9FUNG|nr:hypothetical protein EC957_000271 [Mortierella hygrophila]
MSTEHEPVLSPKGCPIENFPEDPERLFSANGLTLDYPRIGWIAGGCCTFLATAISLVLIYRHYQYYTKPNQQRYIVRMLLMVPIYAITSWFSFVYVREAIYYDTIRVFYEAFVIASFLILLLQYLGESLEDQKRALKRHKKTERWFFPMCCLKYNPSRPHFLQYMKWGILQYVPLNVLGSLLTVVLETQGTYCESSWNPKFGHVWILFINFTSVTLATYFLIMFYFTIRADLKEYEPFYKFLAIKLSLVVEGFVYFGYIKASEYWSTGDISIGINALLIDFEMVIFAIIHLKAFSYKPYVPRIPNPDLPPPEQQQREALLSSGDGGDNREGGSGEAALASLSVDTMPEAAGGRTQQQQTGAGGAPKRKPAPSATPIERGDKKSKKKKKDQGPPEKIMDFTQKTPIWRGILDSFNPLDTIRELSYGCMYMYKWIRGIPVDKDSRRLLDLQVAFGRVRPEVPYTPTEEELKKERKEKRKKKLKERERRRKERKKMGLDTDEEDEDEEGDSSNDDDDDESDNNGDRDLEKGGNRDNNDSDEKDRRRRDADGSEGTGAGQGPVSRYRQFQGNNNNNDGYQGGQDRRADAAYDIGEGGGGGAGSGTEAYGRSTVARKPVKPVKKTAATNPILPYLERDPSIKLEKADAARTERATLPDIQLDPVERKIALSGLYVDLPLSPVNENIGSPGSSVDIPLPMQYRHDHRHQYQPYYVQESAARGGGSEWDYERRQQQRPRDHRLEIDQEPTTSRFDHRDRDLERAAAVGVGPAPYVLPIPVQPISPEPHAPAVGSSRGGGRSVPPVDIDAPPRGGLTRLANDNFVSKGSSPYHFDRDFDDNSKDNKSNARNNNGGKGFTREPFSATNDPRIAALSHYGQQQQQGRGRGGVHNSHHHLHHQRGDSADTSVLSTSTTTDSLASAPLGAGREGFYHHREASRSDPELSHYGLDHEHYLERMHYLEEQERQAQYYLQLQQQQQLLREERRRSQFPMQPDHPEPSSSSSAPVPGPVDDAVAVAGGVTSVTDPDRTSVVIQGEMNSDQFHLIPREKKTRRGGESTLLPQPLPAPVDSQVPDPGKVPSDDSNNIAAAAADANAVQEQQQVVQEDPIVVEYNLLQHRQMQQGQQRTQQELQYQEQQHRRQRQHHQKHDSRDQQQQQQQQQRATMKPPPPPSNSRHQQQQQHLLPRRRNSIESLDSDSSGGGFRVQDYGFRPTAGGGVSRVPKGSRYQQAYRYPMPLPQPVPPAQLYQFPQDKDLYDRQRRERTNTRDRDWDRGRDRDQRYYYQRPQQPYQQQYSTRPYLDDSSRQPYIPQSQPPYSHPSVDTLYRSPPPPVLTPIDDRSSRPVRRAQDPSPTTRDRRDRDRDRDPRYTTDKYDDNSSREPYYAVESPAENLFPASRYAAPFVRDYELQQRERDARQRMTRSPPIVDPLSLQQQQQPPVQRWQQHQSVDRPMVPQPGGRRGTGDIDGRSRVPPSQPHRQGLGSGAYEDDGPYEEAILWTRSPPITVPAPTLRD